MSKYETLKSRFSKAQSQKSSVLEQLKESYRYCMPSANVDGYGSGNFDSFDERPDVYDDTAVIALQKYANRTQAQIVPSWKTWAMFQAGSEIPEEGKHETNQMLEDVTEVVFDHIHHSNFVSQIHQSFQDLGISTGAIICEEGDGISSSLNFRAVPMMELIPEHSTDGRIRTVWRDFTLEASRIQELYPKAKLGTMLSKLVKDKPQTLVHLVEGVVYETKKTNYNHTLMHTGGDEILFDEELDSSPYVVFRENISPAQSFGFGRGIQILPTILKLNHISYYEDVSIGINAAGAYTVTDDGVASPDNIRIEPFALIPVDSNDNAAPSIRPLQIGTRFDVTDVKIKEMQGEIRDVFQSQSFGNIEDTPVRTAYEMSVRENDRMQTTHGAYGRLQSELLQPLLARIVYVLSAAGKIAPMRVDGKEVTIKFTSPAARVQDAEELLALQEYMLYMANVPPEIVSAKFKIEEVPKYVSQRVGLSASLMRNKAEEAKAVQGMQSAAMAGAQAQTDTSVPDVAPPPESGDA